MKPDLASTLSLLAAGPATLDALLRHLPEPVAHVNERPDTWTIAQVVAHLIHGERTDWLPRVHIILRAGKSEPFPAFERESHLNDARTLCELLEDFADTRALNLAQLRALALTPDDLEREGFHPTLGVVTLSQLLACWPTHDLSHLHQISRVLASRYREAVGPWHRYLGVLHCTGNSEPG